jgi:hypothetical protein
VRIILDAKDNFYDGWAWHLHRMYRSGRSSGCGCGGSGCQNCCSTPATAWFDVHRAAVSYWQDVFHSLYGRGGAHPYAPGCPPGGYGHGFPCPPPYGYPSPPPGYPCPPEPDRCETSQKLVIAVRLKATATASFKVCNPTSDTVELEFRVDGFKDENDQGPDVIPTPEYNQKLVGPGQTRNVTVTVNATPKKGATLKTNYTYRGCIYLKTPFTQRLDVDVQLSA